MFTKEEKEKLLTHALETGATYSEIYEQRTKTRRYIFENRELNRISTNFDSGVGVRIYNDDYQVYASSTNPTFEKVCSMVEELLPSFSGNKKITTIHLKEKKRKPVRTIEKDATPWEEKLSLMRRLDEVARTTSPFITQVTITLLESEEEVDVSNSLSILTKEETTLTRLIVSVYAKNDIRSEVLTKTFGKGIGYAFLKEVDLETEMKHLTEAVVAKLSAIDVVSGEYPVILSPGFGAVIFHEACGHALEATSVADRNSPFWNQLGKQIASSKVTLIDDGSIKDEWGSKTYDDEGNETNKNILIEKGILKSFLVDRFHAKKMNHDITGSGRRESYEYIPTSRMNNTYLSPGNDSIDAMFQSISYGIYCKSLNGGTVDPTTGNFNFTCTEGYLIENGQIMHPLKTFSLIGNNQDIMMQVESVSDDVLLETGYCGSSSGYIPVTIGEPTIKVSKILVGGAAK